MKKVGAAVGKPFTSYYTSAIVARSDGVLVIFDELTTVELIITLGLFRNLRKSADQEVSKHPAANRITFMERIRLSEGTYTGDAQSFDELLSLVKHPLAFDSHCSLEIFIGCPSPLVTIVQTWMENTFHGGASESALKGLGRPAELGEILGAHDDQNGKSSRAFQLIMSMIPATVLTRLPVFGRRFGWSDLHHIAGDKLFLTSIK